MNYQPKTTVIMMSVLPWSEETNDTLSSRINAVHAVAVQIAVRCQMDILSIVPHHEKGQECSATIVYANNGRSLADIRQIMQPEINNRPPTYWMILDLEEWRGMLDCTISTRDTDEQWG